MPIVRKPINWDTARTEFHLPVEVVYDADWGIYPEINLSLTSTQDEYKLKIDDTPNLILSNVSGGSETEIFKYNKTSGRFEFKKALYLQDDLDLGIHAILNCYYLSISAQTVAPTTSVGKLWSRQNPSDATADNLMWNFRTGEQRPLQMGYKEVVTVPSSSPYEVTVTHNLVDDAPAVFVYDDSTGELVEPQAITVVDENTIKLTFSSAEAGKTFRVKVVAGIV